MGRWGGGSALCVLLVFVWMCSSGALGRSAKRENRAGFLFGHSTMKIPMDVHVALVGFQADGDGALTLDPVLFEEVLSSSLTLHAPVCTATGEQIGIEYQISYHVRHASVKVEQLEHVLSSHMVDTLTTAGAAAEARRSSSEHVYDVSITELEKTLDVWHHDFLLEESENDARQFRGDPYTIFVVNPRKHQMVPGQGRGQDPGRYRYQYRYHHGAPTQQWVARERYLWIDVAAGPCTFGHQSARDGSVTHATLPRVTDAVARAGSEAADEAAGGGRGEHASGMPASVLFRSRLSSVVLSGVKRIFATDIAFPAVDHADKVIVPIIVLRNHDNFVQPLNRMADESAPYAGQAAPLGEGDVEAAELAAEDKESDERDTHHASFKSIYDIDVSRIRREVKKMLLPQQELLLVSTSYSLADHPELYTALHQSLRTNTVRQVGSNGQYHSVEKPYFDSQTLVRLMQHSADRLVDGVVEIAAQRAALSGDGTEELLYFPDGLGGGAGRNPLPDFDDTHDHSRDPGRAQATTRGRTVRGHRVLPVYVFSVFGFPENVLFDLEKQVVATQQMVLALQTSSSHVPVPYVFGDYAHQVSLDVRRPLTPIVSGLARALGGLVPPHHVYSWEKSARSLDYTWSIGHHPFGPFTSSRHGFSLSRLFVDSVIRNSILSRLSFSLLSMRAAVDRIDAFTTEFVFQHYGEDLAHGSHAEEAEASFEASGGGGGAAEVHRHVHTFVTVLADLLEGEGLNLGDEDGAAAAAQGGLNGPLPRELVAGLLDDIQAIDKQFLALANKAHAYQLPATHALSGSLVRTVQSFNRYVSEEIRSARLDLQCCEKRYVMARRTAALGFARDGSLFEPGWRLFRALVRLGIPVSVFGCLYVVFIRGVSLRPKQAGPPSLARFGGTGVQAGGSWYGQSALSAFSPRGGQGALDEEPEGGGGGGGGGGAGRRREPAPMNDAVSAMIHDALAAQSLSEDEAAGSLGVVRRVPRAGEGPFS